MPGPPPSRNPRRTNARPDWRRLPPEGRHGDPPPWPLTRPTAAVSALWKQLWASPQAVVWDELRWYRVVARYARLVVAAERPKATAALLAEVRQLEDRLGLSPMAMRRLQWEMGDTPVATASPDVPRLDDYRDLYSA